MISPTKRQMAVLRYVQGYQEAFNDDPTMRQIAAGVGLMSHSPVHYTVRKLIERGLIVLGHRLPSEPLFYQIQCPVSIPRDPEGRPLYYVGLPEAGE